MPQYTPRHDAALDATTMEQLGDWEHTLAKPGLSATDIGLRIGASAMEVNRLLKDQGFLYGEPGAYGLTPKGLAFGVQLDNDNGYGGVARRDWVTTYFDPQITKVLDSSADALSKARAGVAAHREALRAARNLAQDRADATFIASQTPKGVGDHAADVDPRRVVFVVAGTIVAVGTAVGVYACVRWVRERKAERTAEAANAAGASIHPTPPND